MTAPPTRRRHSSRVYRRRRAAVLLGLVLVAVLVVWLLVAQPWRGAADPAPAATATPTETAAPVPTPTVDPSGATPAPTPVVAEEPTPSGSPTVGPCAAANVAVEAVASQSSYSSGQNPALSIRLTNNSTVPCTINVGTSGQKFTVTSGTDVWWRSTDCQTEPSDMIVTLSAGQSVSSAEPLTWDRTRSSASTCDSGSRSRAPGGGASYHLAVEVGGIASTSTAQFLLY